MARISGEADYKYVSRLRQVRLYNGLSPHLVRCGLERIRRVQMVARKCQEGCSMATLTEPELQGQVAIVTGAGGGIGAAIARRLARMGALTFLCGRRRAALEGTAEAIVKAGGQAEVAECDVTDLASVEALAALVERKSGRVDILVNNAGVGSFAGPLHQMSPEAWEQVMNTNLRGVYYCMRSFAPMMIRAR